MKKKAILICFGLILICSVIVISLITKSSGINENAASPLMHQWGKILNEVFHSDSADEIYAQGKSAVVTQKEIEQAIKFYKLTGLSDADAKAEAEKYLFEYEALYAKAIEAGFDVSEQEVINYVNEFKNFAMQADNKEDIIAVMSEFSSEDEYWDYQVEVYKKSLPIQKYVESLEQNFKNKPATRGSSGEDLENSWQKEFEQIKESAASEQEFQVVSN